MAKIICLGKTNAQTSIWATYEPSDYQFVNIYFGIVSSDTEKGRNLNCINRL